MSFRRKLLLVFSVSVALSVAAVAWLVQEVTRKAFEETENQRTSQLVGQFQREFRPARRRCHKASRKHRSFRDGEPNGSCAQRHLRRFGGVL